MRNLRIASQRHLRLDFQFTLKDAAATRLRAVAFDPRTEDATYAATTSSSVTSASLVDVDIWRLWPRQRHVASFSAPMYKSAAASVDTAIIAFDFLADGGSFAQGDAAMCLISAGGDIALTPLDDDGDDNDRNRRDNEPVLPEIVGSVEQGILAASWSPDQELLVLVTAPMPAELAEDGVAKGSTLLMMTREFEVLSEEPLQTDDFGEEQPISLGWGSKATQFHGSEGKEAAAAAAAAAAQSQQQSSRGPPLADDDGRPRISWRGDSAVFAVSTLDASESHRVIRTFGKNANLLATSDPSLRGVSHALAFKPSGILMATTQLSDDGQHTVSFIERNGLPKGSFPLRDADPIRELAWNSDGSLLAVWTAKRIQIWSTGNYHWYLKQQFVPDTTVTSIRWNAELPHDFIISSTAAAVVYRFVLDTCVSSSQCAPNEASCAAVVDGRDVLLTPFRLQNVPPPCCSVRLSLDAIPVDAGWATVCLSAQESVSFLHILLPRGIVQIWVLEWGNMSAAKAGMAAAWQKPWQLCAIDFGLAARQVAAYAHRKGDYVKLAVGVLAVDGFESLKLATRKVQWKTRSLGSIRFESLSLGKPAQRMLIAAPQDAERHDVVVARNVFAHENKLLRNIAGERIALPAFFPHLMLLNTDPDDVHLVGLTEAGQLFLNSKLLARDANSFVLTDTHLVWTNVAHEARFLPITAALTVASHADVEADDSLATAVRRIERGARIVTAVPSSMTLVLQMPRGNLETISPRPLVLEAISKSVEARRYGRAFRVCRTHRLDMNILIDHDEARFLHDVPLFVRQVKDGEHLNLFLSSLSVVAPSRFQPAARTVGVRPKLPHNVVPIGGSRAKMQAATERQARINAICDSVREVLEADEGDAKKYVNTILTTHVRKSPPDYAAALQLLADLKARDAAAADEACRYIIFLTDADKLFDAALGSYDFTLPLLVAHHSPRKDPREYLPFLRELRDVQPIELQRFRIDETLQRWERALEWLVKAGDDEGNWERAKAFIEEHTLYVSGMRLYAAQPTRLAVVQELYGDWLMVRHRFKEAAILFGRCGASRKAIDADVKAGSWREALATAQGGNEDVGKLAQSIATSLKGYGRYTEAATVALTYMDDVEEAVRLLCKDLEFGEAKRVAAQRGRADELIASVLFPSVLECVEALLDDVKEMHDQGEKQFARLQELRLRKRERPEEYYPEVTAEEGGNGDGGLDSASQAFTTFTRFTRYSAFTTNAAAARRRRHDGDDSGSGMSQFTMRSAAGSATTAKARKKELRKQGTGKKNSIYEEDYLFGSLAKLLSARLEKVQRDADKVLLQVARLHGSDVAATRQDDAHGDDDDDDNDDDNDRGAASGQRCQRKARQLHRALDSFERAMQEASETLWLDGLDDEDALEEERLQAIQEGVSLGLSWPQLQANGLFSAPLHRDKVAVAAVDWRQPAFAPADDGDV